ncbi:AI-2E family transporter [Nocardioides sp.]|uniref:AI-2E family transporter n=1 Tax=Nocardioides sp. TaxID=35761 RepID=UPI0035180560
MTDSHERAPQPPAPAVPDPPRVDLVKRSSMTREHDRLSARIAAQVAAHWAVVREERDERRHRPEPRIPLGSSNFSRAEVPWGLDLAAAWSWRVIVIGVAGYVVLRLLSFFSVITLPLAIALLLAALATPVVALLRRARVPRPLGALGVVLVGFAAVVALLTFAGQQVATGAADLAQSVADGLQQIRTWLQEGPLHASDSQIQDYLQRAEDALTTTATDGDVVGQLGAIGATLGNVVAGLFVTLFATYFFLADGDRIWAWVVRLAPRAARERVDSSGRVAWISLTHFVRATVVVAAVDAIGIMIGAAILDVPFVLAIGVLVFLGAFVPMVGAFVAGSVAVLVALVDGGPVVALIMLAIVVGVQQLEAHVLQPFLLGRWVSVHPLGVILAIAAGLLAGGVAGALIAVPLVASLNAVCQHLAGEPDARVDPRRELDADYAEDRTASAVPEPRPEPV